MDIVSYLLGKNAGGGGGGGKYAPSYIRFNNFQGTSLDYETQNLDTSNLTTFSNMFYSCPNLQSLNLTGFNAENVTSCYYMFYQDSNLTTVTGLETLTFPSVTDFRYMFSVSKVENITLNASNTNNATFENFATSCSQLKNVSISNAKIYGAMSSMFSGCSNLESMTFNNCSCTSLDYTNGMFSGCSKLTTLDLSFINVSARISGTANMFASCTALAHIDIRNWDLNTNSYNNMFGASASNGVPDDCEIIVKNDTVKTWITSKFTRLTNVKTVAEYEG